MNKKFVLIANGPFLAQDIINEAIQGRTIVALDGAADKLLALNIIPDIILGDFDSIHPKTRQHWGITDDFYTIKEDDCPYQGRHGITIVPTKDQSETDLVKAIRYCDTQQALDIIIICASYGRDDLHEANKLALQTEYHTTRPIILHSDSQSLRWATDEVVTLRGEIGDYCGFMAQHPGHAHTTGLLYPCHQTTVSLCNSLSASTASIVLEGSALLWMPPLLASQRRFMTLPYVTRLKQQWQEAEKVAQYFA